MLSTTIVPQIYRRLGKTEQGGVFAAVETTHFSSVAKMQCESYLSQGRGGAEKWQIRSVICNNREETWTNTVHISYMFFQV